MPRGGARPNSGGARPGAGRKAPDGVREHSLTLRLTAAEYALLDTLQARLSTPAKTLTSSDVVRRALIELAERQETAKYSSRKRKHAVVA